MYHCVANRMRLMPWTIVAIMSQAFVVITPP
jgi:hypothetical protein